MVAALSWLCKCQQIILVLLLLDYIFSVNRLQQCFNIHSTTTKLALFFLIHVQILFKTECMCAILQFSEYMYWNFLKKSLRNRSRIWEKKLLAIGKTSKMFSNNRWRIDRRGGVTTYPNMNRIIFLSKCTQINETETIRL